MIALELPFPPSVNSYYRHFNDKTLISKRGRQFRSDVIKLCMVQGIRTPVTIPLRVAVKLYPKTKRKFDVDNCLKALLDAMQHAGVYVDDAQIRHLQIEDTGLKGGFCEVTIKPL